MDLHTWIQMQIQEALSDDNRYFFGLHHQRPPNNDSELMEYYAEFGAAIFAAKHKGEHDEQSTSPQS